MADGRKILPSLSIIVRISKEFRVGWEEASFTPGCD